MMEFLKMGGYAAYVWSAYGITTVLLALSLIRPIREKRQLLRRIAAMEEQD